MAKAKKKKKVRLDCSPEFADLMLRSVSERLVMSISKGCAVEAQINELLDLTSQLERQVK